MAKRVAKLQKDLCVACGTCVKVCPKNAISIYKGKYAQVDESKCIGCSLCAKECPASIITIKTKEVVA
ncbi:MAG: 4Fe-4S binding protein [Clostridiales bacterium]|nr:4Fe-4S binding protein [Clostridiales bacterium]